MLLGVNIDHSATLRQARQTAYPDPVVAALLAEYAGADSIVAHLREDRRHIKERDVYLIRQTVKIPFNMEMSIAPSVVSCALDVKPAKATLVPERRKELTTEGGLDVGAYFEKIKRTVEKMQAAGITVSLFIEPVRAQIDKAVKTGARAIELHTGRYANAKTASGAMKELARIRAAAGYAVAKGLFVAAGHGLEYDNVKPFTSVREIEELNIGHAIICRAVFTGLGAAVEEMKDIISPVKRARRKKR